jgi:hypothetical protein
MTLPAYALGLVFALLIGALFHVWLDGGAGKLVLYLALSVAGGGTGQWLSTWQKWSVLPVGPLNLGLVALGSLVFLSLGHWLSLVEIHGTGREDDTL